MTREFIEITFGNALTQAKQLDICADSMEQVARSSLGTVESDLRATWEGVNADAYVQKLDLTAERIMKTAAKLREIAQTLRRVAQIFRESELKALDIAQQRTYGS